MLIARLFGPEPAYQIFKQALRHVAKSGEVWCEGVRLFLNPTFSHFSLQRAARALNFAVFFTPQYGDSYLEGIHLRLLLSDAFLCFHACQSPSHLANLMLGQPSLISFILRCSYCEPNYGPVWFSMKESVLSPTKEVWDIWDDYLSILRIWRIWLMIMCRSYFNRYIILLLKLPSMEICIMKQFVEVLPRARAKIRRVYPLPNKWREWLQ